MMKPIIIIGNGISGVTAAREIRKLNSKVPILLISGETDHHFSRTALMYIFMGHMNYEDTKPYEDYFWSKNRIELLRGWVTKIDHEKNEIIMVDDRKIAYQDLILAVGSTPNKFGWPGQDLLGVQGLYTKQDLDNLEESAKTAKHAVVVGGGLIGIEMAECMLSRGIGVTFLVRESLFWGGVIPEEEALMVEKHIREHHCDLRMEEELDTIHPGENGRVAYITTKKGERIDCQIVGLTAGVRPNIGWLADNDALETQRGIMIDHYFKTNLPHVWAIGDCAQFRDPLPGRRPLEQVWYTGKMHGAFVAQNIAGDPRKYDPGIWWNSAKFFDIEYQVYGTVLANPPENHVSLYWEHFEGRKSVRLIYDKDSKIILGINLMGVRYRHEVCEKWIKESTQIEQVLGQLGIANFDPEFYDQYEEEIVDLYNQINGSAVKLKQKRGISQALSFLRK